MSVNTPPGSTGSPAPASPANNVATEQQNNAIADRMVLDYLRARGHAAAEKALANAVEAASPEDKGKQPETLTSEDLVKALAVFVQKPSRPGENVLKDPSSVLTELTSLGNPSSIQNLIASNRLCWSRRYPVVGPHRQARGISRVGGLGRGDLWICIE